MTKRLTNDEKLNKAEAKRTALLHEQMMIIVYNQGNDYDLMLNVRKLDRINERITRILAERYGF